MCVCVCARGFESSLSIPLLGYRPRAPRRHLPPCKYACPRHRRRRGFSPGYPCRDADARPNPTHRPPAGLLQTFRAWCQTVVFSFSPLPWIPGDRSHRRLPACVSSPANRAYLGSCDGDRRWSLACLASSSAVSVRACFSKWSAESTRPRARSSRPYFLCLTRICAPSSPWMHLTVGSMYWCRRQIKKYCEFGEGIFLRLLLS